MRTADRAERAGCKREVACGAPPSWARELRTKRSSANCLQARRLARRGWRSRGRRAPLRPLGAHPELRNGAAHAKFPLSRHTKSGRRRARSEIGHVQRRNSLPSLRALRCEDETHPDGSEAGGVAGIAHLPMPAVRERHDNRGRGRSCCVSAHRERLLFGAMLFIIERRDGRGRADLGDRRGSCRSAARVRGWRRAGRNPNAR